MEYTHDSSKGMKSNPNGKCVVITLWIATEALAEQSDSTGVTLIEDTLGAPRERNKDLTKCEF